MKKQNEPGNPIKKGKTLIITCGICLAVFILAIAVLIVTFNNLITKHDQEMSGEICTIMTEKMNTAIDSMIATTAGVGAVLTAENFSTAAEAYDAIQETEVSDEHFLSMGFVDADKNIYATDTEKSEFKKWELLKTADLADPVSISVPYRSAICGQPVFTMFSRFGYGDGKQGWMFVTYRFDYLQKVAVTSSLGDNLDIGLVDSDSFNVIVCVTKDGRYIGSWTNTYLVLQDLDEKETGKFTSWMADMKKGEESIAVQYEYDGMDYTQFTTKIESMPGWYLVVRIPSSVLSSTMEHFKNHVINFVFVLLIIVFVLVFSMYRFNKHENELLEEISEHDPLTGLLNRRAFEMCLKQKVEAKKYFALIFFDVDHFKIVNDTLGHDIGDELLVKFSQILVSKLGKSGKIFRLGGDEFIGILDMDNQYDIDEKLRITLHEVHQITLSNSEGLIEKMSFSAGIARFPFDADEMDNLTKYADEALYNIKKNGRDGYCWYENLKKE